MKRNLAALAGAVALAACASGTALAQERAEHREREPWNGCTHCWHEEEIVRAAAFADPGAAPPPRSDLTHIADAPAVHAPDAGTPPLFGNVVLGIANDVMFPDLVGARPAGEAYLFGVRIRL